MERLGTVERYFVEVKDIPRLAERIRCFIFSRTYRATHGKVGAGRRGRGREEGRECSGIPPHGWLMAEGECKWSAGLAETCGRQAFVVKGGLPRGRHDS